MRTTILSIITGLLLLSGCSNDTAKGHTVIFDDMPDVYNDQIYDAGVQVGRILEKHVSPTGLVRMVVILDDEWARKSSDNIAFYPRHGRLEVEHFRRYGQPLSKETVICGFASRSGLTWFNIRNVISDRGAEARQKARDLNARFGTP